MEQPQQLSDLVAQWRQGVFAPGLQPYAGLIQNCPSLSRLTMLGPTTYSVFNPAQNEFLFHARCVEAVTGFRFEEATQNRRTFALENLHPEDLEDVLSLARQMQKQLNDLPPAQRVGQVFRYLYRLRRPEGGWREALEQNLILRVNSEGMPDLVMGFLTDITDFKDAEAVRTLEQELHSPTPRVATPTHLERYRNVLTAKEMMIVQSLANGKQLPEMLAELQIKPRTFISLMQLILHKTQKQTLVHLLES